MGKKIRIFKLAKELNIASDELITFLQDSGHTVRNVNSPIDDTMYALVMGHFTDEKQLADKKEELRRKRAIARGFIEDASGTEVAVDSITLERQKARETKRPAILEALAALQKTTPAAKEPEQEPEVPEKTEEAVEETTRLEKPAEKAEKKKAEKKVKTAKKAKKKEKVKATPEETEPVPEVTVLEKVTTPEPDVVVAEKADEKLEKEQIPEPEIEAEPRPPQVGDKIKTIELVEETPRKPRKGKISVEEKKHRKLSKKGKGLAEKVRGLQLQEPRDESVAEAGETGKKAKKRKRSRKKKVDEREVDASIRETLAKMEESSRLKKYKKKVRSEETGETEELNVIDVTEFISVAEFASLMEVETNEVITKCMELGLFVSINQRLDMDTITTVADEFGFEVNEIQELSILDMELEEEESDDLVERSPVVTIMGHVDHGKTSLLDYIRETNVVAGEKGGITQHIGAYEVEKNGKKITFLDTPGHEAFTAMRARGAQATDIVVIVVAADDNVMPQTLEALNHAQAAAVPIIIAINKIDKPTANVEKIKKQLADNKILVESWGGKYQSVEISAKTGQGVDDLLETVLFQAELMELKANPKGRVKGTIIEAQLEKGRGIVCTVLIHNGTLKAGDHFVSGQHHGRIKAMFDERGRPVKSAPPSAPVQVFGFSGMPQAGDILIGMSSEKEAKDLSLKRQQLKRERDFRKMPIKSLADLSKQIKLGEIKELLIILKGDTDGSVEALEESLLKLSTGEVEIKIIHKSIGAITEADVLLASASHAVIVGFHVRPNASARAIALKEHVDIRLYEVIYDAVAEIKIALEGMLEPDISEEVVATAEVRDIFRVPKVGTIAGCFVVSGNIVRNSRVRLVRDGVPVHDGIINSLKRFKDDVKDVKVGFECGIGIENFNDIKIGDVIETYKIVETKRVLE